jgi:hypothetical protein
MRFALFILMTILLDGCAPSPRGVFILNPHTTIRSVPIDGQALDERTHAPIAGAKIYLAEHPEVTCISDSSGYFKLKETSNWHIGTTGFFEPDDYPRGEHWGPVITVAHTNYEPRQIVAWSRWDHVIVLKKLNEPLEPHPWLIFNGSGEVLEDHGARQYVRPGDIRITAHSNNRKDTEPCAMHIGFVHRVYDPQVTPVNSPDKASVVLPVRQDLDWEFMIRYSWDPQTRSSISNVKDSARVYRLEFVP